MGRADDDQVAFRIKALAFLAPATFGVSLSGSRFVLKAAEVREETAIPNPAAAVREIFFHYSVGFVSLPGEGRLVSTVGVSTVKRRSVRGPHRNADDTFQREPAKCEATRDHVFPSTAEKIFPRCVLPTLAPIQEQISEMEDVFILICKSCHKTR